MNMCLQFSIFLIFLADQILLLFFPVLSISEQTHYSSYVNKNLKFSVDIPSNWNSEVNDQALDFSGRRDTDQWRTTINVQVIETGNLGSSSFIADLKSQWRIYDSYQLISEQSGTLDSQKAIRLRVKYRLKNTDELIRQEQIIVLHSKFFYLIGYTAPDDLFDRYYEPMSRALDSYRIFPTRAKQSRRPENKEDVQTSLKSFIQAVQEFRELNGADGKSCWKI